MGKNVKLFSILLTLTFSGLLFFGMAGKAVAGWGFKFNFGTGDYEAYHYGCINDIGAEPATWHWTAHAKCGSADKKTFISQPTSGFCSKGTRIQFRLTSYGWSWYCSTADERKYCKAYKQNDPPAECGSAVGNYFDDRPTSGLCDEGTPTAPTIPSGSNGWTWDWTCSNSSGVRSCKAYKNAQCGSATAQYSNDVPTDGLCNTGITLTPAFDGAMWSWTCTSNESSESCEAYKNLNCRLQPEDTSICSGDDTTINVEGLVPPKGNGRLQGVSWEILGVGSESGDYNSSLCDSFSPDFTGHNFSTYRANYTVTDKGEKTAGCSTILYVEPASCKVTIDSSEGLTVGERIKLKVTEECVKKAISHPYVLQVLYQGEEDLNEESYRYIQEINNNGVAIIEIKKAGSFTFKAAVNKAGDEGGAVTCSSQASAFTSGSEWWERKPE